jgi:SNF2 family DNA or RNA helicase
VENHLGELWSIFEFLNPGVLGRLPRLKKWTRTKSLDGEALSTVTRALKPFILRRSKEQVLDDLPAKTEQTLFCDLDRKQRKLYDELRAHYRAMLDRRIEKMGLKRSKIQVLEALLRLRQAACHPGLLDKERAGERGAKLEVLLEQLAEILDEGHKALVFSQFTSLLAILRRQLDGRKVTYEYLDGRTRKRQQKVERFQADAECRLFLISLKAGGLGLNLTAADYVYILDPWWNPAVEAQAVDRVHRIGQTRPVFAYRLISRDTVEEKILELQESKRELADAIVRADGSMIRNLSAEDLRLLLS